MRRFTQTHNGRPGSGALIRSDCLLRPAAWKAPQPEMSLPFSESCTSHEKGQWYFTRMIDTRPASEARFPRVCIQLSPEYTSVKHPITR